jgi:spermidine synthase
MAVDPISLAQEQSSAAGFELAVLGELAEDIGFDSAFFALPGDASRPTVLGLGKAAIERAIAHGDVYLDEILPVKRAALGRRGVAVDTEVLGERRVRETRYYRDIVRSVGGRHSLFACVPFRGKLAATVMLGRTGSAFSDGEITRIERLLPALGVARASYGLPLRFAPLPNYRESLLTRLGVGRGSPLATVRGEFGDVVVRDRNGFREMVARDGDSELVWTRAGLDDPSRSGFPYIELFHVAAALAQGRTSALFVGLGGAVAVRQFARAYPGMKLHVVEREAAVVELSRQFYALDDIPNLTLHLAEGSEFVARAAPESWDLVIIDAYDAASFGVELARREFFHAAGRALRPGGALAFNVIGPLSPGSAVHAIADAARAELASVRLVPVLGEREVFAASTARNVVVIATRAG